jgi:hypothetical protein
MTSSIDGMESGFWVNLCESSRGGNVHALAVRPSIVVAYAT